MEDVFQLVKNAVQLILERVSLFYRTAPAGVLQLTGVLGLAAAVAGYIHLRGQSNNRSTGNPSSTPTTRQHNAGSSSSQAASETVTARGAPAASAPTPAPSKPSDPPLTLSEKGRLIRKHLVGVKKISISTLGVIFQEKDAGELQEGAQIIEEAVEMLREILLVADVYLITQVVDDIGEAVVLGALDATGIIGRVQGKLKPHKLLYCSTTEGKVSIVRQLEPDLHIDGHRSTIEDLKRFMPQLLHVHSGSTDIAKGPNVGATASLSQFFS